MQQTLVLFKPDALQRRLVGTIISRLEQKGLQLVAAKLLRPDLSLAERHYAVHRGKPFYESLLRFITSGPTLATVWQGREAVQVVRNLLGPTDGSKAPPGTIRGDFALSVQNNLVHASDSPETAAQEIALWFRPEEILSWEPCDVRWIGASE